LYKTTNAARNLDGQKLGRKGAKTRERLIGAVVSLLQQRPVRELRVADITREADATPPTFYRYFESVEDILLATIEERASTGPALLDLVRQPWPPGQIRTYATKFAAAFLVYWEEHFALLHTRNVVADEGDDRFAKLRWSAISPLFEELVAKVEDAQAKDRVASDVNPRAVVGVLMSALERLGAGATQTPRARIDHPQRELAAAMGHLLALAMGDVARDGHPS